MIVPSTEELCFLNIHSKGIELVVVVLRTLGVAISIIRFASDGLTRSLKINIRGFLQTISTLIGLSMSSGFFLPSYQQIRFP